VAERVPTLAEVVKKLEKALVFLGAQRGSPEATVATHQAFDAVEESIDALKTIGGALEDEAVVLTRIGRVA
jgi:hypothetical protein